MYPPYSSLRADPLGTRALYEAFEGVHGVSARRLYDPVFRIENGRNMTLFLLGMPGWDLSFVEEKDAKDLENFMLSGGRVVISLFPENIKTYSTRRAEQKAKDEKEKKEERSTKKRKKSKTKPGDKEAFDTKIVSLQERWGFQLGYEDLRTSDKGASEPVEVKRVDEAPSALSQQMQWHSAIYLKDLDETWNEIYDRSKNPVLAERAFGKGSLVLASDSYFLSNEGLRKESHAELLAWLAGANRQLLFDETHLGVQEDPGIAALMRKYHLHGLIAGLILLAVLFIWKNAASFVPPIDDEIVNGRDLVLGKDSASGFVNLLRRSIAPVDVLTLCFTEWKKSCLQTKPHLKSRVQRVERIVQEDSMRPMSERNPAQAYRDISKVLADRK